MFKKIKNFTNLMQNLGQHIRIFSQQSWRNRHFGKTKFGEVNFLSIGWACLLFEIQPIQIDCQLFLDKNRNIIRKNKERSAQIKPALVRVFLLS